MSGQKLNMRRGPSPHTADGCNIARRKRIRYGAVKICSFFFFFFFLSLKYPAATAGDGSVERLTSCSRIRHHDLNEKKENIKILENRFMY